MARILIGYGVSRLVVLAVALDMFGSHASAAKLAAIWDGRYYLRIAEHGYPATISHGSSVVAFFPLYPLVVRAVAPVLAHNFIAAGIVVSFAAGAAACVAVGALVRDEAGEEGGVVAGWLTALAPGAFFLSPAYAEGLAIALCAVALVLLGRRRWIGAGIAGALGTAASPLALPIVAAALWAAWRAPTRRAWIAPLLSCGGFGAYCIYLWAHTGTLFAWFDSERRGWDRHRITLWAPLHWLSTWSGVTVVETASIALAVGGLWAMARARVPGTWWVYTVAFLGSIVFDSALWMTPRLLLSAFPLVAGFAMIVRPERVRVVLAASGAVMVLVCAAYTSPALVGFVFKP